MAKVVVKLLAQELGTLTLEEGREYLVGRAEDSAIVLPVQRGISRHHLKFCQRDGVWIVELLARFGDLIVDGEAAKIIELNRDLSFSAAPFEFIFILNEVVEVAPAEEPVEPSIQLDQEPKLPTVVAPQPQEIVPDVGNHEATMAGVSSLNAFLRISSRKGREEVLRLEGHLWVAGRDPHCEIPLDEPRASRRHFELLRTEDGYFVTDLGSANGTMLNDETISANEPWQLTSGDVIKVAGTKLTFEIRDLGFHARVPAIIPQAVAPPSEMQPAPMPMAYPQEMAQANVVKYDPSSGYAEAWGTPPPPKPASNSLVRKALIILVPIILYGLFGQKPDAPTTKTDPDKAENASSSPTFDQLGKDQQQAVKDSFTLAKNMYLQGRYELCLSEVKKVHEIVPAFDNSKELETYCQNGLNLVRAAADKERQERERKEAEQVIMQFVDDCRRGLRDSTTVDEIRRCLAPAIERDPEHSSITALIIEVQSKEDQRERKQQSIDASNQRRAAGQKQFEKARALYKQGQLIKAISEYEKFLNGSYPALDREKMDAQRDLANVRKELTQKVAGLLSLCKESLDKNLYRTAFTNCEKALKEDPSNSEAQNMRSQAMAKSLKEMKSIYEDSVLEESMGNVDSAKERWRQILEKAIPGDEYYNKAKRNLQKYGGS